MAPFTLKQPHAKIYVPNGDSMEKALPRVTHLGIGAHQDDLEIMAFHGIKACYSDPQQHFAGIICTNGEGSPQHSGSATLRPEEMIGARQQEQEEAARIGNYSLLVQLGYRSQQIKEGSAHDLIKDILAVVERMSVQTAYIHNLADKHGTHVAVSIASILAMRQIEEPNRPRKVYGCEVWRDLDWLGDEAKVLLDIGGNIRLAEQLIKVYRSQIDGGKRYDQAAIGRARSNATFFQSHAVDQMEYLWYAMDLTPLLQSDSTDIVDFVTSHINKFHQDVERKIQENLAVFLKGGG